MLPYYDPVFVAKDKWDDPDAVLEARSELWHIDRVTGALTTSDLLVGEDGSDDFLADEVPYDSVSVHLNQTPLRTVSVDRRSRLVTARDRHLPIYYNSPLRASSRIRLPRNGPRPEQISVAAGPLRGHASSNIDNIPSDAFNTSITLKAPPDPIPEDQTVIEPPPPPPRNTVGRPIPKDWIFILTHREVQGKSCATEASLRVREEGVIIPRVTILGP